MLSTESTNFWTRIRINSSLISIFYIYSNRFCFNFLSLLRWSNFIKAFSWWFYLFVIFSVPAAENDLTGDEFDLIMGLMMISRNSRNIKINPKLFHTTTFITFVRKLYSIKDWKNESFYQWIGEYIFEVFLKIVNFQIY